MPRLQVHTLDTSLATTRAQLPAMWAVLDTDEQAQAQRFVHEADRIDYIAAHGLRRTLLGTMLSVPPQTLRFAVDEPRGKPRLAWPTAPKIDINLRHTRGLVACAAVQGLPDAVVGIDTENTTRLIDDDLAMVFCTPDECAALRGQPPEARTALWVAKEALIKASGRGFELDPTTVSVSLHPTERVLALPARMGNAAHWRLACWRPTPQHWAALAWRASAASSPSLTVERRHGLE